MFETEQLFCIALSYTDTVGCVLVFSIHQQRSSKLDIILSAVMETAILLQTTYKLMVSLLFFSAVWIHLQHGEEFQRSFGNTHASLGLSRCEFSSTTATYLGHLIEPEKLRIRFRATESLQEYYSLHDERKRLSFLVFCSDYCQVVDSFAHIADRVKKMLLKQSLVSFENFTPEELWPISDTYQRLDDCPVEHLRCSY